MSKQEDFREMSKDLHVQFLSNPWTIYETGCEDGYQYAKDIIGKLLLCVELSNFFPMFDENEETAKGRKRLIEFIHKTMDEL